MGRDNINLKMEETLFTDMSASLESVNIIFFLLSHNLKWSMIHSWQTQFCHISFLENYTMGTLPPKIRNVHVLSCSILPSLLVEILNIHLQGSHLLHLLHAEPENQGWQ